MIPQTGFNKCNLCALSSFSGENMICVEDYYKPGQPVDILLVLGSLPLDMYKSVVISKSPTIVQLYKLILEVFPDKKGKIAITSTCKCVTRNDVKLPQMKVCANQYFRDLMCKVAPERIIFMGAKTIEAVTGLKKIGRGSVTETCYGKGIVTGTLAEVMHDYEQQADFKKDIKRLFEEPSTFDISKFDIKVAENARDLDLFYEELKKAPHLWTDIESSTKPFELSAHEHRILSMSFTKQDNEAFVIPLDTLANVYENKHVTEKAHQLCKLLLTNPQIGKTYHNGKFDVEYIWFVDGYIVVKYVGDTMLKVYLVKESIPNGLKDVTNATQPDLYEYDRLLDEYKASHDECNPAKGGSYLYMPNGILLPYNGLDTIATYRIDQHYTPLLNANPQLLWLYNNVMIPVFKVYMGMEANGILFDRAGLEARGCQLRTKAQQNLEMALNYLREHGIISAVNLRSREQVANILLQLGEVMESELTVTKAGKFSTDENIIDKLIGKGSVFAKYVNNMQKADQMESKYVAKPLSKMDNEDRVHPEFGITTTDTGRSSSFGGFNTQNITGKYRVFIIATPAGKKTRLIAKRDFSQLEIRMMASTAKVSLMLQIYNNNGDVHKLTAGAKLYLKKGLTELVKSKNNDLIISTLMTEFGKLDKDSAKNLRQGAKPSNFGFLYKGDWRTIIEKSGTETDKRIKEYKLEMDDTDDPEVIKKLEAKITKEESLRMTEIEAQEFEQAFFLLYPEVKENYHKFCEEFVTKNGYIVSPFGRIKWLPEALLPDTKENARARNHAINAATNMPIQSGGNELKFLTLIDLDKEINRLDLDAMLINEVHDEVCGDVGVDDIHKYFDVSHQCMDFWHERLTTPKLLLPIPSDMKIGLNYGSMEETNSHEAIEKFLLDKKIISRHV